jgi:FkbM family methyltransferase
MNSISLKQRLLKWRRHAALLVGNTSYCKVGQWELMQELFSLQPPGVFIEAGVHDGWTGSNTYWLEASLGWRGILVEPIPGLAKACRKERPHSKVFHGALVSHDYGKQTIDIECSGLVSAVLESSFLEQSRNIAKAYYGVVNRPLATVPALTLDHCIRLAGFNRIDFLSLDVEGFEAEALQGLDLRKWQIPWLFIECNDEAAVFGVLGSDYEPFRRISSKDILFRRLNYQPSN